MVKELKSPQTGDREGINMLKKLTLELGSKFPYIDTDVPFERSVDEVIKLLKKFKCDEILTYQNGEEFKIAFRKGGWPYLIEFPLTYIKGKQKPAVLNMQVSGRIVYNKVKSALVDAIMDEGEFREAMFRYVAIPTPGGLVLLADVVAAQKDRLLKGQIELDPEKMIRLLPGKVDIS